ncbi:hypothetical protein [Paenibacillus terrae]|nr:hypothetical protein [Paenibacillus terrae]
MRTNDKSEYKECNRQLLQMDRGWYDFNFHGMLPCIRSSFALLK